MTLSWIEDIASEYYRKIGYFVFNNVSYFETTPGKQMPGWQEMDILAIKNWKVKIISCKRGLRPSGYDREAQRLQFHGKQLLEKPQLEKYQRIFSGQPELILLIEYPRPEHVDRISKLGINVQPLDDLLLNYLKLLKKELEERKSEGREMNYATRLLKGLLRKKLISING